MTRVADIPAPNALLCEGCGYTLHHAPTDGNCPECGKPISESSPDLRSLSPWEDGQTYTAIGGWLRTTAAALFTPRRFFRGLSVQPLTTSGNLIRSSGTFGHTYRLVTAFLLGIAASVHYDFLNVSQTSRDLVRLEIPGLITTLTTALAFLSIEVISLAIVHLTAWEAAYRGLRLPRPVVARALNYHAIHLVPPALLGLGTVLAYDWLNRRDGNLAGEWIMGYIYTLSGEVIVSAGYLFVTYWAAMKSLMYANKQNRSDETITSQATGV
jgi:hypothetical protein